MQMEMQQAQIELTRARAVSDQGLGLERASRVEENQALAVERRAQAARDEDAGLLDKVKALKELEQLDIVHLEKLIALSNMLRTETQDTNSMQDEQENRVESAAANQLAQNPALNMLQQQNEQQVPMQNI